MQAIEWARWQRNHQPSIAALRAAWLKMKDREREHARERRREAREVHKAGGYKAYYKKQHIITALTMKTVENGCTPEEAEAAQAKLAELRR
jgi:hypothetical protein